MRCFISVVRRMTPLGQTPGHDCYPCKAYSSLIAKGAVLVWRPFDVVTNSVWKYDEIKDGRNMQLLNLYFSILSQQSD